MGVNGYYTVCYKTQKIIEDSFKKIHLHTSPDSHIFDIMTQFIVSARKYRPARFQDVLGQEHISHTLKMAFSQDKLAHAFLFTGPRGVGKTTCARILAKALNCINRTEDYEPCGKCEFCVSFDESASFSIFELDAASNNSVDHIRSLVEQVRIPPLSGRYKVFIIDEVHMLTTSAFNAFLKTLEEPPSYAVFILATTERHKILPTILSRCQIFDFRRIQVFDIVKQLNLVASQEGVKVEEQALHLIATKADGAMRDALSIFDRIAGATNNNITYQAVTDNLNLLDYTNYFKVVDQLLTEDLAAMMLIIDDIMKRGFDPEVFLSGLMEHFRQILVSKDSSTIKLIENTESVRERYAQQASLLSLDYILSALQLCNECDINFRTAKNKRLLLEMTMIKMVYLPFLLDQSESVESKKKIPEPSIKKTNTPKFTEKVIERSEKLPIEVSPPVLMEEGAEKQVSESVFLKSSIAAEDKKQVSEPVLIKSSIVAEDNIVKKINKPKAVLNKLSSFEKEAMVQIAENSNRKNDIKLDDVLELIAQYKEKASPTISLILTERKINGIEENIIQYTVASNYERESLITETALLEFLRYNLKNYNIAFRFEVDASLMDNTEEKPMTKEEKLTELINQNSLVSQIIQKLDLKIDE